MAAATLRKLARCETRGGPVLHWQCMQVNQTLLHFTFTVWPTFTHAAPLYSAVPSALSSPSSQSGAPTANKGPSTEMETLTAAQQGMLHAVSLDTSAPHSVVGVPHSLGSYVSND